MKRMKILASAALLLCAGTVHSASIAEPSTVFYGKVIGVGDAQPYIIHEGALLWTIKNANGSNLVFKAALFPLKDGEFSYRLDIPHSAVAYQVDHPGFGIPLPAVALTNSHVSAFVNGLPVEFIGPSGSSFTAGQILRAQTYRLDMAVNCKALDSDGDGMPDWWEDKFGLDKQSPADALLDLDGDGILSCNEYLRGTNPAHDDRHPSLASTDLLVFPGCVTGIRVAGVDIDTAADDLIYTLTALPRSGALVLRNAHADPDDPDQPLAVGSQFTQSDVNSGHLVYVHQSLEDLGGDAFALSLNDGSSGSNAAATIKLTFYEQPEEPSLMSTAQQQRQRAYLAAQRADVVLWDAVRAFEGVSFAAPSSGMEAAEYNQEYLPSFGAEIAQVMTGGRGDDQLCGGMADDILVGGIGQDTLTGGGGADIFYFDEGDNAADVITDFNPLEGDRIALSGLLAKNRGMMHESVSFAISGSDTLVTINAARDNQDLTTHVLKLENVIIDALTGYELVLNGSITVGRLKLQPCISIAATDTTASESGRNSGLFTFTRQGDLAPALDVNITIGGTAQSGVDYSAIQPVVHFEAGESMVTLEISPFPDDLVEKDEIVEVTLAAGSSYCLGRATSARVTIKDLEAVIGVEVLQARGSVNPRVPAVLLITREGQIANALFVRLKISGQAANGVDYEYVAPYVNFTAGQTTVAVPIVPTAYATLSGGAETVRVDVELNSAYALADVAGGSVVLVERLETLALWKSRVAPQASAPLAAFALQDVNSVGLDYLRCYAYGIDPANPQRSRMPQLSFRNGRLNLDLYQNPAATDLRFVVEGSTDLRNWSAGLIRTASVPALMNMAGVVTYEAVPTAGTCPRLFMRVRVVYGN